MKHLVSPFGRTLRRAEATLVGRGRELSRSFGAIILGLAILGFFVSSAFASSKQRLFRHPKDRTFQAALTVARQSAEARMLKAEAGQGVITFRADVDRVGPSDRVLGDYWTGLAVRISVSAKGERSSIVHIEVERVYPAPFNNIPQRMSPRAEESEYANRFLKRLRSELRRPR